MRILLSFNGTRGDAQPVVALGRALNAAGHTAVLSGPPDFQAWAEEHGLDYRPRGLAAKAFMQRVGQGPSLDILRAMQEMYRESIVKSFDVVRGLAAEVDLVVGAGVCLAERSAAECAGRPYVYLNYCPALLPSTKHPPSGVPWEIRNPTVNRALWAFMNVYTLPFLWLFSRSWRQQGAQIKLEGIFQNMTGGPHRIIAADPELAPTPPEFVGRAVQVGAFHLMPEGQHLDPAVEAFLEAGPPPIYLGFGSMTTGAPGQVTAWGVKVAEQLGCRMILGAGWGGLGPQEVPANVLVIESAPHLLLFPRCAGAIHHGGAGTTAAALRSGVPQFIVPHFKDQYYFGHRVRRLGLGPAPVVNRGLTLKKLQAAVAEMLEDAAMASAAREVGQQVRQRDALALAIEALEQIEAA
ncbi:MAG: glycosyltransferase family 1 protein [Alphaproteobacteria bacterium]|nr:glycosyltransferase family 1 protein [Alphaproteobacteria bacterium]